MEDFRICVKFEYLRYLGYLAPSGLCCAVHHFLQHYREASDGREAECWRAGQRRPVYNSFGLSLSHVSNLSLACFRPFALYPRPSFQFLSYTHILPHISFPYELILSYVALQPISS